MACDSNPLPSDPLCLVQLTSLHWGTIRHLLSRNVDPNQVASGCTPLWSICQQQTSETSQKYPEFVTSVYVQESRSATASFTSPFYQDHLKFLICFLVNKAFLVSAIALAGLAFISCDLTAAVICLCVALVGNSACYAGFMVITFVSF